MPYPGPKGPRLAGEQARDNAAGAEYAGSWRPYATKGLFPTADLLLLAPS
jgi:hypothetical protein